MGSNSITAIYSGDSNNAGSTSPAAIQTVNEANPIVTLSCSPNPAAVGQSVDLPGGGERPIWRNANRKCHLLQRDGNAGDKAAGRRHGELQHDVADGWYALHHSGLFGRLQLQWRYITGGESGGGW